MDLLASVRDRVLRALPHDDKPAVLAAIGKLGARDLLTHYLNWRDRFVPITPRRVFTSAAYDRNPIVQEHSADLAALRRDIERGAELTKYLSRRVKVGFDLQKGARKNLLRRQHLDLLLNDWGIYHLHLSQNVEEDGFVQRGNALLYAAFTSSAAYLIDVMTHDDFNDDHLLRVIIETWPQVGLVRELSGLRGARNPEQTSEQRKGLRSVGFSSCYQHEDGRLFVAGRLGISNAGTSTRASVLSGRILWTLASFQKQAIENPTSIRQLFCRQGLTPPTTFDFEFSFFANNGYGVIERRSGASIGLGVA